MKTGEKWKRGDLSAIAVVFDDGSVRMFNVKADCDCFYLNAGIAVERGWVKTHEADGTPFMPVPKPGELWYCAGDVIFITSIEGKGVTKHGDIVKHVGVTRRLYPPMEEAK